MKRVADAYRRRDPEALAELVHPDARLSSLRDGEPVIIDRGRMIENLRVASTMFLASFDSFTVLSDSEVICRGSVRKSSGAGGHSVTSVIWLFEIRDGRLYRSSTFSSEQEALAAARQPRVLEERGADG